MSLPRFGVTKPVPANLLMMAALIMGVVAAFTLRREFFPETSPDQAQVTLIYPGATPQEIEESMARKVEDAIAELDEVDRIVTTLSEGGGGMMVEFRQGVNIDRAVRKVEQAVEQLTDLPAEAERIRVTEFEPMLHAIMLTLYGSADEESLKQAIRRMRDDLKRLPGMGEVRFSGVREYEVRVDVSQEALLEHGLSLPAVADAVRTWMSDVPGGVVRTGVGNINVRTLGVPERAEAVRNIVVRGGAQGQALRLGEIATVRELFVDDQFERRFNGQPSVSLTVFKKGTQDAVQIAEMVRAYATGCRGEPFQPTWADRVYAAMNESQRKRQQSSGENSASESELRSNRLMAYEMGRAGAATHPIPGQIATHSDLARFIEGRLELLSTNALQGAVLVFFTLLAFLNWRAAFWVMTGLITALCGTMVMMSAFGITLNLLTMFGLIMVVGMLVDDAIVVAENIQARHDRGEPSLQAAVRGAEQVAWPVVGTVTTTIVAFLPLTFIRGRMGDLMGALPWVVTCALAASLIEAILILPSHMGHSLVRRDKKAALERERQSVPSPSESPAKPQGFWSRALGDMKKAAPLQRFEKWRDHMIKDRVLPGYSRMMRRMLEYRYITTAATIAVLIISIGMYAGGRLEFVFLESSDSETIIVDVRMPIGTPLALTQQAVLAVEQAAQAQPEVRTVSVLLGQRTNIDLGIAEGSATHVAQMFIELVPVELRDRQSSDVIAAMREHHGLIAGVEALRYSEISGGPGGPSITIQVKGDDAAAVTAAVGEIKTILAQRAGVHDVADDAFERQREVQVRLKPAAATLGLSTAEVAQQVRAALFGIDAHVFSDRREDIDVRVRLDERSRRDLSTIDNMWVVIPRSAERGLVPLREIADIVEGTSSSVIRRIDRERAVSITADTSPHVSPETITADMRPQLEQVSRKYAAAGVTIDMGGRQRDLAKAMASLPLGMAAAVLMIYVILAWLFSSYIQPLLVMMAIPFGVIGVVWGHMLFGYRATFLSLIGFIALCGIVVNNSLILVEFYNQARREGLALRDALVHAGRQRLRPIVLTSLTTFLGLTPLMLQRSFQAQFLIPMAISIAFGLISSAFLVLTVLPCFMVIVDDLKGALHYLWFGVTRATRGESTGIVESE